MTDREVISLIVIDRDGQGRLLSGNTAQSLMEALRDAGVGIAAICGGTLSCGTCHVYLDHDDRRCLHPPSDDEEALMSSLTHYAPDRSRLSCQIQLHSASGALRVWVAPEE